MIVLILRSMRLFARRQSEKALHILEKITPPGGLRTSSNRRRAPAKLFICVCSPHMDKTRQKACCLCRGSRFAIGRGPRAAQRQGGTAHSEALTCDGVDGAEGKERHLIVQVVRQPRRDFFCPECLGPASKRHSRRTGGGTRSTLDLSPPPAPPPRVFSKLKLVFLFCESQEQARLQEKNLEFRASTATCAHGNTVQGASHEKLHTIPWYSASESKKQQCF